MAKKSAPVPPGPLGWIDPGLRTPDQAAAHAVALAKMRRFAMAPALTAGPVKVMLTDFWKAPEVVADVGYEFTGYHQLTGSCVGASLGNAIFTLAAVQRTIAENPTKAFVPWWPFTYGRTRYNEGDRGPGEGAVDSVAGQTLIKEGIPDSAAPGLPQFNRSDGLTLTSSQEMQWSDGGSALVKGWSAAALAHPLGGMATVATVQDIKTALLNGYPVLDGCEYYIGSGRLKGTGANAYVVGNYDGRGGHSTCYLGYWDHPTDGPLYLYSNQWPASTYPRDPAGAGRCCVWVPEAEVAKLFRYGGSGGESMALSHLTAFPAQPEVLNWIP
jgi:hypothetical protein